MNFIDKTAIIGKNVNMGQSVTVGPYSIVEDGVELGDHVHLGEHVIVRKGTRLSAGVQVDAFAVIGGAPQDFSFDLAIPTETWIGESTVIREHVTVHRSTHQEHPTRVGSHCLLMAGAHVGHDGQVGDAAILANNVLLGGHVEVGSHCFIGGGASIHQWCVVGDYAIVGGYSGMSKDVPPYAMAASRNALVGLNFVGLKRANIPHQHIAELKAIFEKFYHMTGRFQDRARALLSEVVSEEARHFLEFFLRESRSGFVSLRGGRAGRVCSIFVKTE